MYRKGTFKVAGWTVRENVQYETLSQCLKQIIDIKHKIMNSTFSKEPFYLCFHGDMIIENVENVQAFALQNNVIDLLGHWEMGWRIDFQI